METLALAGRFAQYVGAALVFGWPLFAPHQGAEVRRAARIGGLLVVAGAALALAGQTATMTGSAPDALSPGALWLVASETTFGHGVAVRVALAIAFIIAATSAAPRPVLLLLGAATTASFALTGHAASGDGVSGLFHQAADALHALAAVAWIGAVLVFLRDAFAAMSAGPVQALWQALARFSGAGSAIVATLLATGLVNGWILVGPQGAAALLGNTYGRLLIVKLGLFGAMLLLAGANRFLWTPRLGATQAAPTAAMRALRLTLCAEALAGLCVLGAVAAMGLQPPPAEIAAQ